MRIDKCLVLLLVLVAVWRVECLDNGVALRPPLLLSTGRMGCKIDEIVIKDQIDQLMSSGLAKLGYNFIVIEDCWQGARDSSSGKIKEDSNKFPSGMKQLVAYAHAKGISVGLGTDVSEKTALGRPGSMNYQKIDAITYAEWGIDWVGVANSQNLTAARQRFTLISQFLQQTGRKMVISIDTGGRQNFQFWAGDIANVWTTTAQQVGSWESLQTVLQKQLGLEKYAHSGAWNDPGFIFSSFSNSQFLAQYSTWLGLKAPIRLLAPLSELGKDKISLLLNQQLLAIGQDQLKKQAKLIKHEQYSQGWQQVWGSYLSNNCFALFFINGMSEASPLKISLSKDAGLSNVDSYWIRDPVAHVTLGSSSSDTFTVSRVGGHGVQVRVLHF